MFDNVWHFFRYQFPAIAWGLLIFLASSVPSTKIPPLLLLSYDKLIHIIIFFIFCILVYRALAQKKQLPFFTFKRVLISIGVVILYGAIDELHQGMVPGRTLDKWDLCADTVGGLLAGVIIYVYVKWKSNKVNSVSG